MKFDQLNYLAIEFLEHLTNKAPTQKQIDLVELLLKKVVIHKQLIFDSRLNQKEIACLHLAALGKSSKDTANLLNLTQAKIESYRKEIKRKLCCSSIAQAIFEGIRYGYIQSEASNDFYNQSNLNMAV